MIMRQGGESLPHIKQEGGVSVNIFAEVTIDETGIIRQMDAVKAAGDKYEDEMLKLREMLAKGQATAKVNEKAEEK